MQSELELSDLHNVVVKIFVHLVGKKKIRIESIVIGTIDLSDDLLNLKVKMNTFVRRK